MSTGSSILSISPGALSSLRAQVRAFLDGSEPLAGLDLYFSLERETPLLEFHTMFRPGPQNRARSGLQQSYGDHNRLLLLGLDRLEAGDLEWYRSRLERPDEAAADELLECFAAVRSLGLTAPLRVALWLAAALHDCGKVAGGAVSIDVEDGVAVAREMLDALCPEGLQDLALFVIRNHDYVKDVFLGEVPVAFIADQVDRLAPPLRKAAVAALGMVQVAGAASLGEGRLTRFRLAIFRHCIDQRLLADRSAATRLARLLDPPQVEVAEVIARRWEQAIEDATAGGEPLRPFLERVPVHGWHRVWPPSSGSPIGSGLAAIRSIARRFRSDFGDHDHVVIGRAVDLASAGESTWRLPACESIEFLNGTRAMVVGGA